jgi:hypothetical protein
VNDGHAVYHPKLVSEDLCAPCHNQHNTVDEWKAAPAHLKGDSCHGCHMPLVQRPQKNGAPPKMGRDHSYLGGHSLEMLLQAFTLKHEQQKQNGTNTLVVRLINDKCGHNFPTDSRHRAVDLIVTFYNAGGVPFPAVEEDRPLEQASGTYRKRFRNPYRSETGMKDTQIRAGKEAVLEAKVPENAHKATIRVIFKLTPFLKDSEGTLLAEEEVTF